MNCKEFESTLNDIAREALTDAEPRRAAEAHAAGCEPCAALLSDSRSLTAGLRALSAEAAGAAGVSARVEANLLAAFRAQKTAAAAAEVAAPAASSLTAKTSPDSTPVVVPFAAKRWTWTRTFGAAGMAAAAAVAFALLVPPMLLDERTTPTVYQTDSRQPSQTDEQQPSQAQIIVTPDTRVAHGNQAEPDEPRQTPPAIVNTPRVHRGATMTSVKYGGGGGARNNTARASASPKAAGERPEITTDFIPLAQGGGFVASEGGHVVRVELPRSALARFGLPVNAEFSDGRVKADVLLGEDGMARAIRFVR